MFFFPGDLIENVCRFEFVYLLLTILRDITSLKICLKTVCLAREAYGNELLITTILATLAGNADGFTITLPRLARGLCLPSNAEYIHPKL